jgi:DegV family protein with EDD domain
MSGVRVVTDSASDLPGNLLEANGIIAVPLDVRLGDPPAAGMRGCSGEEFWRAARATDALAETSAPSPGEFAEAFLAQRAAGADAVCCLTISSALSATYQSARAGAEAVADQIRVEVVDSRQATMGEGLMVLRAAELAGSGASLEELTATLQAELDRYKVFGTLENLETLRRGGRIGSAQALIGSLLSIKPVVELRDGVVEGESRQRTRARSLRYLAEKVTSAGELAALAVVHADASDLDEFLAILDEAGLSTERIVTYIGPVIGAHTGLGTIGVCLRLA